MQKRKDMSKDNHIKPIHLAAEELSVTRDSTAKAVEYLELLARIILEKLGHKNVLLGPDGICEIRIRPYNTKAIFYGKDGRCVGVYEDPPGICSK
jgi:hypothetical protein